MASRTVTAQRIDWAVKRLAECRSTTAVIAELAESEGISRRQAQNIVGKAHGILVDDLEQAGLDRRELVAQLHHALMESLSKALQSNQPAAAVSACRAIADIFQLAPVPRRP
jgi:hypothetical protein